MFFHFFEGFATLPPMLKRVVMEKTLIILAHSWRCNLKGRVRFYKHTYVFVMYIHAYF